MKLQRMSPSWVCGGSALQVPALLTFDEQWHIQDVGKEAPKSILHWYALFELLPIPPLRVEVHRNIIIINIILRLVKPGAAAAITTSNPEVKSS